MPNSYGLVVEGSYDKAIFQELLQKARGEARPTYFRGGSGLEDLKKYFPALLRDLEHAHHGNAVDKALVIRDADGKEPATLEADLRKKIQDQTFAFRYGVSFYAVRQKVETLLLADPAAINKVAESRGVLRRRVRRPPGALESIVNPKEHFVDLLSQAGLQYTPEVCREIAATADLAVIKRFCPSFEDFIRKATHRTST